MKYSSVLLVLMVLSVSLAFADDPIKTGKAALEKGDFLAAITAFQEAVHKDKKNAEASLCLGIAYLRADSVDQSVAALVQARELDSSNAMVYVLLGDAYVKQNIPAAAVEQYQHAVTHDSSRADVYLKLARVERKTRQYNDAASAYIHAIRLDTTNFEASRELSDLYMLAKMYANAVPLLRRFVEQRPDEPVPQIQLVKALFHTHYYEELIPTAKKVIQRDSSQKEILHFLAAAYTKTRNYVEAEKTYLLIQQRDTVKAEEYLRLAQAEKAASDDLAKQGQAQKASEKVDVAIASYEKAYRADSTQGEIYYDLGTLYMKVKRYSDAVGMFEKKIATDTTAGYQWASNLNAGSCLISLKEPERARKHVLESIRYKPEYVSGWQYLGICYAQMDSIPAEMAAYQRVIELATAQNTNGESGKFNAQLGEAHRIIGVRSLLDKKYDSAVKNLKMALQYNSDPKDLCDLNLLYAQALHSNQNKEDAIKYYRKSLEICPKNSPQHEQAINGLKMLGEFDVEGK